MTVNGRALRDVIDYRFASAEARLVLEVERGGRAYRCSVEKPAEATLGLEFTEALFTKLRVCNNGCFFCFVDGVPEQSRSGLHIKDDDYRLSFLFGNFVTLTNLVAADWQRLAEQRLSPLYVSVHATDLALRRRLLANAKAPDILTQLRRLGSLGIQVHTQVVLCPGLNDGDTLDQTIGDLSALYPTVQTVSVVPVGFSEHYLARPGAEGRTLTPAEMIEAARQIAVWQRRFHTEFGRSLVYAADELYLKSRAPLPSAAAYDGFPQFHNGIGMVRSILAEWALERRRWRRGAQRRLEPLAVTIVCGTLIAPVLERLAGEMRALTGIEGRVVPVVNRYFGATVGASGLLTGQDVLATLANKPLGDVLALPRFMLDAAGARFLDDLRPADLEAALGVPVVAAESPRDLVRLLERGVPRSYAETQAVPQPPPWRLSAAGPTAYYRVRRPRWEHPVALTAAGL